MAIPVTGVAKPGNREGCCPGCHLPAV